MTACAVRARQTNKWPTFVFVICEARRKKFSRGCALDRHDHAVAARSPGAPSKTAARAGSAQTPSTMEKMARYTATRPQIQSDFMKQSRGRVPRAPASQIATVGTRATAFLNRPRTARE